MLHALPDCEELDPYPNHERGTYSSQSVSVAALEDDRAVESTLIGSVNDTCFVAQSDVCAIAVAEPSYLLDAVWAWWGRKYGPDIPR